jgi:hypothetical protein
MNPGIDFAIPGLGVSSAVTALLPVTSNREVDIYY